jgi:alkylhydroperoxidase/carboxymuconolactone decarboxylase family protein YurZ
MAKVWFMEILEQHDPEFAHLVAGNREVVMKDGAIPARYKVLMTLLVDAILGHAEGVHSIAQRARAAGASEQEICETVRVAYDCGGMPALITALGAFHQ